MLASAFQRKKGHFLLWKAQERMHPSVCVWKRNASLCLHFLHFLFTFVLFPFFIYTSFSAGAKGAAIMAHLYMGNVEVAEEIRRYGNFKLGCWMIKNRKERSLHFGTPHGSRYLRVYARVRAYVYFNHHLRELTAVCPWLKHLWKISTGKRQH